MHRCGKQTTRLPKPLHSVAALAGVCVCLLAGAILGGCGKNEINPATPIAHTDSFDIWPDSIDLHHNVILRAVNDSTLQIRVNGNPLDTIPADTIPHSRMTFSSGYPILDLLYRLEASQPANMTWNVNTPWEIYLNPLGHDSITAVLESRLKHHFVIPHDSHHALTWPVVNENAEWLLAASEYANVTSDESFRHDLLTTARQLIDTDLKLGYNPSTALFYGMPRYMGAMRGIFPPWMSYGDLSSISTLAVNVAYQGALRNIPAMSLALSPDSLSVAMKKQMWIPNMGYFSSLTYGIPYCQLPLQSTDNLAQAVAILTGSVSEPMGGTIIAKTPVTDKGVALLQPSLPSQSGQTHNDLSPLLLQVAWCTASARVSNREAYNSACGALFALEGERLLNSPHTLPIFRSTFTAYIIRCLLGMQFRPDGIFFAPFVPDGLPGDKRIGNLRYKEATLDITVSGTGNAISTFSIDGTPSTPFLPADLKGHHTVAITLAGASIEEGEISPQPSVPLAPPSPKVTWPQPRKASISHDKDNALLVYLNGSLQEEIFRNDYQLFDAQSLQVVQFVPLLNSQFSNFSGAPHLYLPPSQQIVIDADSIASPGSKMITDKEWSKQIVESNRHKNRNLSFEANVAKPGRYLMQVEYLNGLGIVNHKHRNAIRNLRVNGKDAGVVVFTQNQSTNPADSLSTSWQRMTAWSNCLVIHLHSGKNILDLRFLQPSPVYIDPQTNILLFRRIRLLPTG